MRKESAMDEGLVGTGENPELRAIWPLFYFRADWMSGHWYCGGVFYEWKGVIWPIFCATSSEGRTIYFGAPRCPECMQYLRQEALGRSGYRWFCLNESCGFETRKEVSAETVHEDLQRQREMIKPSGSDQRLVKRIPE